MMSSWDVRLVALLLAHNLRDELENMVCYCISNGHEKRHAAYVYDARTPKRISSEGLKVPTGLKPASARARARSLYCLIMALGRIRKHQLLDAC